MNKMATTKRKIMASSQSLNCCSDRKRRASTISMINWSNVPVDVLGLIASKITSVEDYLALGAVCRWWRSGSKQNLNPMINQWLMQVPNRKEKGLFYSFNRDKSFEIDLPQIAGRDCFGSPFGWLFTCKVDISMNLFNPLSKTSIPLPNPMQTLKFSDFYICKAVLTAPPRSPDCLVIIYYNDGHLAFTRPGDTLWYPVHTPHLLWKDFIYFNTNLYACNSDGQLYVFDRLSSAKRPQATAFAPSPWDLDMFYEASNSNFLVDLGGELCLLVMFTNRDSNATTFEVYKINVETKDWTRVKSLGNWCLVLEGLYGIFSVNVDGNGEVSQHEKMSPGCIYWPNPFRYETKVWNVEKNQLVEPHSDDDRDIYTRLFPTIRINPSLLP